MGFFESLLSTAIDVVTLLLAVVEDVGEILEGNNDLQNIRDVGKELVDDSTNIISSVINLEP